MHHQTHSQSKVKQKTNMSDVKQTKKLWNIYNICHFRYKKEERKKLSKLIYIYLFENHSHLQEKLDCGERETKRDRASIKWWQHNSSVGNTRTMLLLEHGHASLFNNGGTFIFTHIALHFSHNSSPLTTSHCPLSLFYVGTHSWQSNRYRVCY